MRPVLLLWLAAALVARAAAAVGDAQAIQGKWKLVAAELSGQPLGDDLLKIISLRMDHGNYEVFVGDEPDRGTYAIDPASDPKGMVVTGTEGPNHGRVFPAIYELKGDTLRICYDLSGAKRPAEFRTVAGTKLYLVTYRRQPD